MGTNTGQFKDMSESAIFRIVRDQLIEDLRETFNYANGFGFNDVAVLIKAAKNAAQAEYVEKMAKHCPDEVLE